MSGKRYNKQQLVPSRQPDTPLPQATEAAAISSRVQTEFFYGPVPPPSLLARYNDVVPDGAERILAMAERQSKHRELLESQVVTGNVESQRRGSMYAFIIAMVAILGGIFLIYAGKDASGLGVVLTSLVGLISVFVYSQHKQSKERTEKSAALEQRRRQ
jgi:uncharacterized membrane protein